MKYLLATHALIWFLNKNKNLSAKTRTIIEEADTIYTSIVSLWEVSIKFSIGKVDYITTLEDFFDAIEKKQN